MILSCVFMGVIACSHAAMGQTFSASMAQPQQQQASAATFDVVPKNAGGGGIADVYENSGSLFITSFNLDPEKYDWVRIQYVFTLVEVKVQLKQGEEVLEEETFYFHPSEIDHITYFGGQGGDQVGNNTSIPSRMFGNVGDDILVGGKGNDEIYGEKGMDLVSGFDGADFLDGGYDGQVDIMIGGQNRDKFVIHKPVDGPEEVENYLGFDPQEDVLVYNYH